MLDASDRAATADTLATIADTLAVDVAVIPDAGTRVDTQRPPAPEDTSGPADTQVTTDTTATDTGNRAPDVALADATMPDTGAVDTAEPCITTCYQPNGVTCKEHLDCQVEEEVPGKCAGTQDPCTPALPCPPNVACEGYKAVSWADVDPDGNASPWSPVQCLDGECHEGQQMNAQANECCSVAWDKLCVGTDYPSGCSPWGPAAPPAYRADFAALMWSEVA